MERIILHSDMNNCYASIESILNPNLKGKPVAVCGSEKERHGIVLAKSNEAKSMGVITGEAIWEAKIKCKDLIIVPPNYKEYLKYSILARKIYYEYTNQVEPYGIDECFLDITNSIKIFGSKENIAEEISYRMKKELGLTVSIGVSFNKTFAKLASDMKKSDSITYIEREKFKEIVWPLKVEKLMGIGSKTKEKLNNLNIITLGQLANYDVNILKSLLGVNGIYLHEKVNGIDNSIVDTLYKKEDIKSIGHGITCREDLITNEEVKKVFLELSLNVSKRLIKDNKRAKGVRIYIKNNQLNTYSKQGLFEYSTQSPQILANHAMKLFCKSYSWDMNIRALSITAIDLIENNCNEQLGFFSEYKKRINLEVVARVIYNIREKYDNDIITFACLLGDIKLPKYKTEIITLPSDIIRN